MKTFNRTSLPEVIIYNKKTYKLNIGLSAENHCMGGKNIPNAVQVAVLSRRLRKRTGIDGKPYTPSIFIFTLVEPENTKENDTQTNK